MKRKSIKLYLTHTVIQEVRSASMSMGARLRQWLMIPGRLLENLGLAVFYVCYWVGLALLYLAQAPYRLFRSRWLHKPHEWDKLAESRTDWSRSIARTQLKFRRFLDPQVRMAIAIFAAMLVISSGLFGSARIVNTAWELKARVLGAADNGLAQMNAAQDSLRQQETGIAEQQFLQAITNFRQAGSDVKSAGGVMNALLNVLPQKRDAEHMLSAIELLGKSGLSLTRFYDSSKDLHFSGQGLTGSKPVNAILDDMQKNLQSSLENLQQADLLLKDINPSLIPADRRLAFTEARDKISILRTGLGSFADLFDTLALLARGDKRVLLLFENNNELRPGGGFIGTYGEMKLRHGSITAMHVSSIYDLDGQLREVITPPRPFWELTRQWYMRDSNWFFDFPQTARKVVSFYEKEGGETPDVVIAMTPNLMVDILKITGPVEMPAYGVTLSADNFVEQTQFETSVNYDKTLNRPKQFLADFIPSLFQKISSLPQDQLIAIIESVQKNLGGKQLLIYSRDPDIQRRVSEFNWGGEAKQTDRDYLAVVSANLNGSKTDLAIQQEIQLQSEINPDNSITNTVTVTRTNPLPARPGMGNKSFLRVLVPLGSTLLSTQGFSPETIREAPGPDSQPDPDIYDWEKNSVKDIISDTIIGEEAGKTFFGNWVIVPGQSKSVISIKYRLPFELKATDHHSLLFQKQAGSVNQNFSYDLILGGYKTVWKNSEAKITDGGLSWPKTEVARDFFYGLVINKPE